MEAKRSTFWNKMIMGVCIFTLGGASGYFLKDNINEKSAASSATVTICHKAGNVWTTMEVSPGSVEGHLRHGDFVGRCNRPAPGPDGLIENPN